VGAFGGAGRGVFVFEHMWPCLRMSEWAFQGKAACQGCWTAGWQGKEQCARGKGGRHIAAAGCQQGREAGATGAVAGPRPCPRHPVGHSGGMRMCNRLPGRLARGPHQRSLDADANLALRPRGDLLLDAHLQPGERRGRGVSGWVELGGGGAGACRALSIAFRGCATVTGRQLL
jgi:hypothetical protein